MHLLNVADHSGHTVEVPELTEKWGLGRVVANCRGFEGKYEDVETGTLKWVFLGRNREEAVVTRSIIIIILIIIISNPVLCIVNNKTYKKIFHCKGSDSHVKCSFWIFLVL